MTTHALNDAFDWAGFEGALEAELRLALAGLAPLGRRFRAMSLYGMQHELDGLLALPMLGADEESAAESGVASFWSDRFTPDAWSHAEILVDPERALALEKALTAFATRGTREDWLAAEQMHTSLVVRIAGRLAAWAPTVVPVTDDFVFFVHDEDGGPELAARTMPEALVARHFADDLARDAERAATRAMPPPERARFLVSRFGKFDGLSSEVAQKELLAMGEGAIEALVEVLADPENGWTAAMVLGKLGIPRPEVIDALRANVGRHLWHATALGLLGDHAWLAQQSPAIAVNGHVAPLRAWTDRRRVVDYGPLTALLDAGDAELGRAVEAALAPGKAYCSIGAEAVPSVLEGLGNRHAVIRWHAASLLRDRGLGSALGARILPALAARLDDPSAVVRRLAVLSIAAWKADGAWLRPRIEAMREDPDDLVRKSVAHVLTR